MTGLPFCLALCPTASSLTDKDALTALAGILGTILTLLGTTVAIVSFSGTRQENLSSRIRQLAKEHRESPPVSISRKAHIDKQLNLFQTRLGRCVFGHICLYVALGTEIVISLSAICLFATIAVVKFHNLIGYLALVFALLFVLPFWPVLRAVQLNIMEYCDSNKTMGEELMDIPSCLKEIPAWHEMIDSSKLATQVISFIYFYFRLWGASKESTKSIH